MRSCHFLLQNPRSSAEQNREKKFKKKKNFAQVIHHTHCITPFTGPLTENFPSLIKCQQSSEMNAFKVCVKDSQQDPESKASAKGENG